MKSPLDGLKSLIEQDLVLVNRQSGSGTRLILDYELKQRNITPSQVKGYDHEVNDHFSVAECVANRDADIGIGTLTAARALGLKFIPIRHERYDLVIPYEWYRSKLLTSFLTILHSDQYRDAINHLGGYDTSQTGDVVARLFPLQKPKTRHFLRSLTQYLITILPCSDLPEIPIMKNDLNLHSKELELYHQTGFLIQRHFLDAEATALLQQISKSDPDLIAQAQIRKDRKGSLARLSVRNTLNQDIYSAIARSRSMVNTMEMLLGGEVYHYHHKMIIKQPGGWRCVGVASGLRVLVPQWVPVSRCLPAA